MPRISVITPLYNGEKFIAETIESVRGQTLTGWEHTVVDDGGIDNGPAIVSALALAEPRLKLLRQPNGHICNARNNGFAASSPDSEYLLFLDHDDILEPEFLSTMSEYLDHHPEAGAVYCCYTYVNSAGEPYPPGQGMTPQRYVPASNGYARLKDEEPETPFCSLMAFHQAIPSCTLYRRSVYERAGGWDEATGRMIYEDKDLVLRCALIAPVHLLNRYLIRYRQHENNTSRTHNPGWHRHYENRWLRGDFLTPDQRTITRRGIAFDRMLSGRMSLRDAADDLRHGRIGSGIRKALRGAKKLATSSPALVR